MIPNKEEILGQMVRLWRLRDESEPSGGVTMGELASDLMYPPVFIIEALEFGKAHGVLEHDYDTDKLTVVADPADMHMGDEIERLMSAVESQVRVLNLQEVDLSLGLLQTWSVGVRPSALELACRALVERGVLYEYVLADPKDKKSEYTFYTLDKNKDEQWGIKQFKVKK